MKEQRRKWCIMDLVRDKRGGTLSTEKVWYNIKSGMSCWALMYYMEHPSENLNPWIIVVFLLFNETAATVFITLARKYGGDIIKARVGSEMGGGESGRYRGDGDEDSGSDGRGFSGDEDLRGGDGPLRGQGRVGRNKPTSRSNRETGG